MMLAGAIAIGVLSVGTILAAYAVLTREMARNYIGTNPASATIKIRKGDIQPELVNGTKRIPGVLETERHATIPGRMKIGDVWHPMLFFVIDDFQSLRTNKFTRLSGAWPPPEGTMLVEQTALRVMESEEGGRVIVRTPHGEQTSLKISGVVHDPGLAPAGQEQEGYGYITLETLPALGETQGFDELRITTTENSPHGIEETSQRVADWVQGQGYSVEEIQVPPPRRHPHQGQLSAILLLFLVFSFLTLILSAILVSASIATLMTKQVREIGVMKAIGAKPSQVSLLYFGMQLVMAFAAVVVAIPLSTHAAALLIQRISTILNVRIFDSSIPWWVYGVQGAAGILIPLAAAAAPVLRASRIAVEPWLMYPTAFVKDTRYDISRTYPDKGHGSFMIIGVPPDTKLVKFRILDGRWLDRHDDKEVVLNHMARAQAPNLKVGEVISLWAENRRSQWKIAGFVEDIGSTSATAYVSSNALAKVAGTAPGSSNDLRIALDDRAQHAVIGKTREIEDALEKTTHVKITLPIWLIQNAIEEHMSVLVSALLALAILMAIVGAYGLASTMSMNIMERTREIGVMRAIGATPKVITQMVVAEGFAVAALSVLFALGLSVTLSSFMGRLIGNMAFRIPFPLAISALGFALWMVILVLGSSAATILPARRATNMTVREALAYE